MEDNEVESVFFVSNEEFVACGVWYPSPSAAEIPLAVSVWIWNCKIRRRGGQRRQRNSKQMRTEQKADGVFTLKKRPFSKPPEVYLVEMQLQSDKVGNRDISIHREEEAIFKTSGSLLGRRCN
jgi:hypothetical protein